MLMQESLDLNSMRSYAVALKECLRETMLHQDLLFRKQVKELHRLYRMQKILMEDIGSMQIDTGALEKACTRSAWLFYSSNQVRRESPVSLTEDARLSSTKMVLPDRHDGVYNNIPLRSLGLQLCSDQCASHVDHDALNLSLSGVGEDKRMKSTTSVYLDQKDNSCAQNIIDLEVSSEGISNENGNHAACTTAIATMTKWESQISVLSNEMENSSIPFGDAEYPPGFQDCHKALMINKLSPKDCISHEARKFDLNQVQLDDSSCNSSDNLVTCHSTASSLHNFGIFFDSSPGSIHPCSIQRKESSKSLNDASNTLQWDDAVNSVVMNSKSVGKIAGPKCKEIKGGEAGLWGSKSVSTITQEGPCKDLSYCMSDPDNKEPGSTWKRSVGQFTGPDFSETVVVNCENTKDDEVSCACQSAAEEKCVDGNVLPALSESSCGSMKDRHPCINLGDAKLVSPDQHLGTLDGNDLQHDCPKQVVELPEVSMCIQTAAQLLINFSLGNSCSYQDCPSKAESIKVDKEEIDKMQCSDSYEQIVLELEECNADDCSASSKPYEVDSTEKNDFGLRLRRGRRFKDFQKEILPGLASLSGHEIQEDINILEAVLRSREYRKIRSKMGDHGSWCAPIRSRRSKRNYVRRKIF